jgi:acyl transferase domain-containing protein/NADPH:quinone reductase-like Zn-dependent oxidoreductase/NADP-dependent 3-hydroxy acid dehydrogenase YdfG/acyl carrier protein
MQKRIAIVGFSFRLPGVGPDGFWESLEAGRDLVTRVPDDRWAQESYFHPRKSEPGKSYSFAAGTLGDVTGFDAAFFGISPREAAQIDPQQRLLLELTWEALERGGIRPSSLRGSGCAVYIGFSGSDYSYRRADDLASIDASMMTGSTGSVAANRLSYQFDLRGPSMVVDTACSSSLVAFHQGCQAIRAGEAPMAMVGGVSLHLHPFAFIGFSKASMLSRRGLCNVFDAAGDGYVRSEGAGIFVLKDLDAALADGDHVFAVVAGSAVNCDGRTNGLTVPGCETQATLLRDLYDEVGIEPGDVDYIEAHGTGTAVGDPIETRALGLAIGERRPADAPLLIGSVKSNLGHLETASSVAGLAKALYCLEQRSVPPTIHLETVNPNILLDEWNLAIATANTPLPAHKRLVVGVNSFGFGGANAHVILENMPEQATAAEPLSATVPLVLSARCPAALRTLAAAYAGLLRREPGPALEDVAYNALFRRDQHRFRAAMLAPAREDLLRSLDALAAGIDTEEAIIGEALDPSSRPVFAYSGNGSQWAGMGLGLLEANAVFRSAIERVDSLFARYGDFSLLEELRSEQFSERLGLTEIAQPTLFAVQVGITEVLRAWGVVPGAVVGHSVGEVAAAWACGALSLEQAVRVVAARSAQQGTTRGQGGMTAVGLGADAVAGLLLEAGLADRIVLAGINSPRGVTVAGDLEALHLFERRLAEREVFQRRLKLDYAFHSPAMDPIEAPLKEALRGLRARAAKIPFYSTVTGARLTGTQLGAPYWWRNAREPVAFESAINAALGDGHNVLVEIGPSAILRNYLADCLRARTVEGRVVPTMMRDDPGAGSVQRALLQLLVAGAPVDLGRFFPAPRPFLPIPTYPWQHEHYVHPVTAEGYRLIERRKVHPLLGYRLHEHESEWENQLDTDLYPLLSDHRVGGAVVVPAAGFVDMALAAAYEWFGGATQEIEELEIRAPLLLEDGRAKVVRLRIDAADGGFVIRSRDRLSEEPWLVNVVGRLLGKPNCKQPAPITPRADPVDVGGDTHYRLARAVGLEYGPAFQTVAGAWCDGAGVMARLTTPDSIGDDVDRMRLHPSYLDGCFQLLIDALRDALAAQTTHAFVPVRAGRVLLWQPGVRAAYAYTALLRRSPRSVVTRCVLYDDSGMPVASLEDVRFRALPIRRRDLEHADFLAFRAVPMPRSSDQLAAPLPPTERLAECARRCLHDPERRSERGTYYGEVEPLLDVLCGSFAQRALRDVLGQNEVLEPDRLIASGVVAPERRGLLAYLVGVLEEDGILEPTDSGWCWAPDTGLPEPHDVWISLLGDYPDYAAEVLMVGRVGLHLAALLAGQVDDHGLLGRACSSAMLAHYNAGSPSVLGLQRAVVELLRESMAALPAGRRLRVLEWCDCHSSVSARLLAALDFDRCDYVLAASASEVLEDREALLERFPAVRRQLVSLDSNQSSDDEDDGRFDLVLLPVTEVGVFEAGRLLDWLHGRVVENGVIMLVGRHPTRWADLVFGMHTAQRDVNGEAGGASGPLMRSPAAWQSAALRHGFRCAGTVHDLPELESGIYLMLLEGGSARAASDPASPVPLNLVVLHDQEGYGAALAGAVAGELRAAGHRVVDAVPGNQLTMRDDGAFSFDAGSDEQAAAMLGAVQELYGELNGLVDLRGLRGARAAGSADAPEAVLAAEQGRCMAAVAMWRACQSVGLNPSYWLVTVRAMLHLLPDSVRRELGARSGDADDAPLWGLARTAMNEYPDLPLRLVDCADPDRLERMAAGLVAELLAADAEDEVILTSAGRYAPRLRLQSLPPIPQLERDDGPVASRLDFTQPGPLKHLVWRQCAVPQPGPGEVSIEVRAAGLNFRDVMYAMGLLSDEAVESGYAGPTLGMELSGCVRALGEGVVGLQPGDEVIAFAPASFSTHTVTGAGAVMRKPEGWSFEAAATVATTFFTVYYALHHLARLQEGERILIHGAAGGVGIAAIQFAKYRGAEIFATAGSDEKRDVVRMLGADHVMDSRSLAFADEILARTDGQGVDVVLNSLAGEAINRNLRVLRPFGRFLELGKRDYYENTRIGLRPFRNNIAYFGIDADQLMAERPELTRRLFTELMALFADGDLKPLPFRAFPAADVVEAFRYMQQSRQIGKIVISFRDPVPGEADPGPADCALQLPGDASYLVTGGLSGFGLRTAEWLARRGARHLVLLGRRGAATPEAEAALARMRAEGVEVRPYACDVTRRKALAEVLSDVAANMPPLRGVVHAAMVLSDGLLRNLDEESLHRVLAPKVLGARHLDDLTRELALDFFVLYSSATTLFGNPGQGNYVAANHYLEALAGQRRAEGLPATCLSWGAIEDVGYLARNPEVKEALKARMGGAALAADEAFRVLEQALLRDCSGFAAMDVDWSALRRFLPTAGSPKFAELARRLQDSNSDVEGLAEIERLLHELEPEELEQVFVDLLRREVADILRISPDRLDPDRSMYDQGMDSLMGMELVAAVEARFGVKLPIMALSEGPTISRLVERIIRQLKMPESAGDEPDDDLQHQVRSIAARHVGDVDTEAVEELAAALSDKQRPGKTLLEQ